MKTTSTPFLVKFVLCGERELMTAKVYAQTKQAAIEYIEENYGLCEYITLN